MPVTWGARFYVSASALNSNWGIRRYTNHGSLSVNHVPGTVLTTLHISSNPLNKPCTGYQCHLLETLNVRLRGVGPIAISGRAEMQI